MEEEFEPCIVIKPEIDSGNLVIVKEELNEEYEEIETFEEETGEIQIQDSQLLEEKEKSKRSRKSISIGDKIEICEKKKNGTTVQEISKTYGIDPSTISRILKGSEKLMKRVAKNPNILSNKKQSSITEPRLERAILIWLQQEKSKSELPVFGSRVQEKALEFAETFGMKDFKASRGWYLKFKKRNHLTEVKEIENVTNWMEILLLPTLKKYSPDNIFTIGEFALFYRALPKKTFEFRNNCMDGKYSRERITACFGTNKSGTEKLPLIVVGRNCEQSSRKVKTFPVKYYSETNSWMTPKVFEEYLLLLNKKFASENRLVLVLIETNSAHSLALAPKLTNIRLIIHPPSSVSPLRLGIVANLKQFYRKEIISREVNALDAPGSSEAISIMNAMTLLAESWEKVSEHEISKAFVKAGWVQDSHQAFSFEDEEEHFDISPFFQSALRILELEVEDFLQFVTFDDHVATSATLTDEEICRVVTEEKEQGSECKQEFVAVETVVKTEARPEVKREMRDKSGLKRRNVLTLYEKIELIERKKSGLESTAKLCEEYGVCQSVISRIMQSEQVLRERCRINPHAVNTKRINKFKEPKLEEALVEWLKTEDIRDNQSRRIRSKAKELADLFGYHDFRASHGWWAKFKRRHGLKSSRQQTVSSQSLPDPINDPFLGV